MTDAGKQNSRTYLGIPLERPKVAFFELTSCEGCQLQLVNNEASLPDLLSLFTITRFREAMTEASDDYEIAFVEGSVTRDDEEGRLKKIRENAKVLVAFGSCACFGGVNQLKNRFKDQDRVNGRVYGNRPVRTGPARPLDKVVKVDLRIFGCPVNKEEVEKIVVNIAIGKSVVPPKYPVCMECKANENVCLFDLGEPCLGPVTRGGCDSWCPNSRFGCWGCRGPAEDANLDRMTEIMRQRGIPDDAILDRYECFGGFAEYAEMLRTKLKTS